MYYFLRGASAACIFFSGGPKPPLIKFGIFHQEKTCPPEENKAPPLRKKSAPLKIQSARKFTASPPKRYLGRRVDCYISAMLKLSLTDSLTLIQSDS